MSDNKKTAGMVRISYGDKNILIARDQCRGSIYINPSEYAESGNDFIRFTSLYGKEHILVADLNRFVAGTLGWPVQEDSKLALVLRTDSLSPYLKRQIVQYIESCNRKRQGKKAAETDTKGKADTGGLSKKIIGFRINMDTEMIHMDLSELKLFPDVLRGGLKQRGFLALSFGCKRKIQYLLDVERILACEIAEHGESNG